VSALVAELLVIQGPRHGDGDPSLDRIHLEVRRWDKYLVPWLAQRGKREHQAGYRACGDADVLPGQRYAQHLAVVPGQFLAHWIKARDGRVAAGLRGTLGASLAVE
jgi:hypothetical protein